MVVIASASVLVNHYAFAHGPRPSDTTVLTDHRPYDACQADGATVSTAMAAFSAQNPGVTVTESDLTGSNLSGPYIQSWPYNPQFYIFSLYGGILYLQAPGSSSTPIAFTGPSSCSQIGLQP